MFPDAEDLCSHHSAVDYSQMAQVNLDTLTGSGLVLTLPLRSSDSRVANGVVFLHPASYFSRVGACSLFPPGAANAVRTRGVVVGSDAPVFRVCSVPVGASFRLRPAGPGVS